MNKVKIKLMNRLLCVLLGTVLFGFTGMFCLACDPATFYYKYKDLKESVISVELIEYEETTAKRVLEKDEVDAFDFEKSKTLQTLEQSRIDDFCLAFSNVEFFKDEKFPDTPIGRCLKLTYSNGDFLIVICHRKDNIYYSGTHLYDENGNIQEVCGCISSSNDFINFLNNFFDEV